MEQLTSDGGMVYLISTCSNIRVSSAGSLVPSAFRVYAKRTLGSATLTYPDGYLAARGYSNGIWSAMQGLEGFRDYGQRFGWVFHFLGSLLSEPGGRFGME